ncbi:MAG: GAF domain-containing protein [Candidatus Eisenbacteria sp.]|nr:GAF domain-containing protein [Candidatus Eisenbacteria bacterium]
MAISHAGVRGMDLPRLLTCTQRLYGRVNDLQALLDVLAQTLVELLEEIAPNHSNAVHLVATAGLLSRRGTGGTFRPLRLKGRPDPEELRNFMEHVGPGDSQSPTGLMGWSVARRMVAMRQGQEWFVAERDDEKDRWAPLRPASGGEVDEMRQSAIAAYPSLKSQLAVPILDPEIRGQARPRDAMGILNVESDELLSREFCEFMIGFSSSAGYPLLTAVRLRDMRRLTRRLSAPLSRSSLAGGLLDATLPYLPGKRRRGMVALRDPHADDCHIVESMTTAGLEEGLLRDYRAGRLRLSLQDGVWGEAIRTGRTLYIPDLPRAARKRHKPLWKDTQCALVIPLVSGRGREVLGLLGLESGETSYAFSTQDMGCFEMHASLAAVAAASIEEARLEHVEAVRIPALLQRLKRSSLSEVPEDQIVRINAICRALVKHGFVYQKAAEDCRLTVHILREYTSRSPRIIDVDALRTLAARCEENIRAAVSLESLDF